MPGTRRQAAMRPWIRAPVTEAYGVPTFIIVSSLLCTERRARIRRSWRRSLALEGDVQGNEGATEREVLDQLVAALLVGEMAVAKGHTRPAALVPNAARGLPREARAAGTELEAAAEIEKRP
jgi:hypothetical protein